MLNSYLDGNLALEIKSEVESELRNDLTSLQPAEAAILAMLRARLKQAVDGSVVCLIWRILAMNRRYCSLLRL